MPKKIVKKKAAQSQTPKRRLDPTVFADLSRCVKCSNLGAYHVPSWGSPFADIMLIGQSPGTREVEVRSPFVGPSGDVVTWMLEQAGLRRKDVYITNALKCHPPGNRPALSGELQNCWSQWLHTELSKINPRIAILTGKDAHKSVLPEVTFEHLHTHTRRHTTFLSVYHPAYFLRRGETDIFVRDVGDALRKLLETGSV